MGLYNIAHFVEVNIMDAIPKIQMAALSETTTLVELLHPAHQEYLVAKFQSLC